MSDTHFYLRPVPGRLVRDPATGQKLPDAGARKPRTPAWVRYVKAGDVEEYQPSAESSSDSEVTNG